MAIIDYFNPDENAWKAFGDTEAKNAKMEAPFKTGLLHLVYYFLHTLEGRKLMHEEGRPGFVRPNNAGTVTRDEARNAIKSKCVAFGVVGAAQEAIVSAHLAGWDWVAAHKANNAVERDKQEAAYKQSLTAVSWALWEEGSGKLFPLGW